MFLIGLLISLIILIFSAILHEVAHGIIADRLGDPTPRLSGRLTLDPRPHIDPLMSIILPLLLILTQSPVIFGGAKPVPVDPFNLREGRKDIALVSLAGPLTNILLAIVASLVIKVFFQHYTYIQFLSLGIRQIYDIVPFIFYEIVQVNLFLAIFNLLPIPPLDGSKIVALLLPERNAQQYLAIGQFGMVLIFAFLFFYSSLLYSLYSLALRLLGLPM